MTYTIKINFLQPRYEGQVFDGVEKLDDLSTFEGAYRTRCGRIFLPEEVEVISENAPNRYRHGGPYDRGSADAYYGRQFRPHYYEGSLGDRVEITQLNEQEFADYSAGYDETPFNQKGWG